MKLRDSFLTVYLSWLFGLSFKRYYEAVLQCFVETCVRYANVTLLEQKPSLDGANLRQIYFKLPKYYVLCIQNYLKSRDQVMRHWSTHEIILWSEFVEEEIKK